VYQDGVAGKRRDLHLEFDYLAAGEYLVFVEFDGPILDFSVTAYGSAECEFLGDENMLNNKVNIVSQIMMSKACSPNQKNVQVATMEEDGAPDINRFTDFSGQDGYGFIVIRNDNPAKSYREECVFEEFNGMAL
jgi:hypothetical protein